MMESVGSNVDGRASRRCERLSAAAARFTRRQQTTPTRGETPFSSKQFTDFVCQCFLFGGFLLLLLRRFKIKKCVSVRVFLCVINHQSVTSNIQSVKSNTNFYCRKSKYTCECWNHDASRCPTIFAPFQTITQITIYTYSHFKAIEIVWFYAMNICATAAHKCRYICIIIKNPMSAKINTQTRTIC